MAPRDRKRSSSSSRARKKGGAGSESTEDALEKLFAEAMGAVESARKKSSPTPRRAAAPPPDVDPDAIAIDVVGLDESFHEEASIHYVIDEDDPDSSLEEALAGTDLSESDRTPEDNSDFERLNAELEAALDDDEGEPSTEDLQQFILESFSSGLLSDDDPDLAFPDFDDGGDGDSAVELEDEGEDADDADDDLESLGVSDVEALEEVFAGGPDGEAQASALPPKKRVKTALPGAELDAVRARVANLGRLVEEREYELRAARDRVATLNAQLVAANRRGAAISREFETFRRRAERDREEHRKYAAEKVLKDFLGVYDNLERALAHAGPDAQRPFGQGVSMTLHQFEAALRTHGVERVDGSPGAPFDPVHHEAVGQFFSDELPQGAIGDEMQAGFMLHGRLLRAAMVTVSRGPEHPPEPTPEDAAVEAADAPASAPATDDADVAASPEAEAPPAPEADPADPAQDAVEAVEAPDAPSGDDAPDRAPAPDAEPAPEAGPEAASPSDEPDPALDGAADPENEAPEPLPEDPAPAP